jgi:hypothetical protein
MLTGNGGNWGWNGASACPQQTLRVADLDQRRLTFDEVQIGKVADFSRHRGGRR